MYGHKLPHCPWLKMIIDDSMRNPGLIKIIAEWKGREYIIGGPFFFDYDLPYGGPQYWMAKDKFDSILKLFEEWRDLNGSKSDCFDRIFNDSVPHGDRVSEFFS